MVIGKIMADAQIFRMGHLLHLSLGCLGLHVEPYKTILK